MSALLPQHCISGPGEPGDCYRACLATILGVPIASLPNFNATATLPGQSEREQSIEMDRQARAHLAGLGWAIFNIYCSGEWPIEKALAYFSAHNRGCAVIFQGMTTSGEHHAVVALDGKIAFDPSGAGIVAPMQADDGPWWFMDLVTPIRMPA